jgi:hypothetical protein
MWLLELVVGVTVSRDATTMWLSLEIVHVVGVVGTLVFPLELNVFSLGVNFVMFGRLVRRGC